jgi:hypothetical protein
MSVRVVLAALALAPAPRLEPAEVLEIAEQSDERDRLVSPLRPREGGGYDYSDPKGRFNAVIQPDGRVTISLPPALRGGLCLGALNCVVVEDLWDYLRSPEKWQPQLSSTQEWMAMHGAPVVFGFSTLALGALEMPMRPPFIGVGGSFGRRFAPRRAIMDFMRHTFEMRLGLAAAAQRDLIAYELSRLDDELDALWAESWRPLADRRALLFELWDQCLEGIPRVVALSDDLAIALDRIRHQAAAEARRKIVKFVRKNAPWGAPNAYTAAELHQLNARRISIERFDPYHH